MKKLDKIQQGVVDDILSGDYESFFLTGEGGTGKSAVINELRVQAIYANRPILLLAPTNSAANNINGRTIHSAFGLNLEVNENAKKEEEVMQVIPKEEALHESFNKLGLTPRHIIVIDEISMGGSMFKKVLRILREWEREKYHTVSTLVLVGDPSQLPPVNDKAVDWSKVCNKQVKLKKNYRTQNVELKEIISKFRKEHNADIVEHLPTVRKIGDLNYDKDTTYIAYKNSTLAELQYSLLGNIENWTRRGDIVQSFGSSNDHEIILCPKCGDIKYEETINDGNRTLCEACYTPVKVAPYFVTGDELVLTSDPIPLMDHNYPLLFEVPVRNKKYNNAGPIKKNNFASAEPWVIVGDYNEYRKMLIALFKPVQEYKRELFAKYKVKSAKDLKKKFNTTERAKWGKLWSRYLRMKGKPFARHAQFITSYKAQGKSLDKVVVMWDELRGNSNKYVAISRAKYELTLVTEEV